jgi:hypothetical protein
MARYAEMRLLDIWYDQTTSTDIEDALIRRASSRTSPPRTARVQTMFAKARGKDQMKASGS